MGDRSQSQVLSILGFLSAWGLKYMASGFLTAAVLSTASAVFIVIMRVLGSDMAFLRYLSFTLPIDAQGKARLDGQDVMRVFSLLSLIALALVQAAGAIGRWVRREVCEASRKSVRGSLVPGLRVWILIITVIFGITALVLPFANLAEGTSLTGMYGVIVLFYVMAIVSNTVFILLNNVTEGILARVRMGLMPGTT